MTTANAAVLEACNAPLRLRNYPLPSKPEPGAALIATRMAGICGTDVHIWRGELPVNLPIILGHETVGVIEQLGEGLTHDWSGNPLAVGDRVTWTSTKSCGHCYYCSEVGQPTRCRSRQAYGIGYSSEDPPHFLGGYAEYHYLMPGACIFKLPETLSNEAVIGAGCALVTAIHGIERAGVGFRDTVVVQGAGPVGISALAIAHAAGARKVIVLGGPANRLKLAGKFGADRTLNIDELTRPELRIELVKQLTDGAGADVVIECTGVPRAVPEGMEMCRDGGKYLVLGHYCDAGTFPINPHVITRKQLQVSGSWSSEPRHMKRAIEFLSETADTYPFASLVTHHFPLEEANAALETVARWEAGKCVIVPGGGNGK